MTSIAYSFVLPVMSLFLVTGLSTPPAFIGLFTVSTAIMSIWVNQQTGKLIDKGVNAKHLFSIALGSLILTGLLFSVITQFWQAVLVGVIFFSMGNACIPILLTMIRQHADQTGLHSTKINAQMRAGPSLVWIVGPTISFTLIAWIGFSATYLAAAGIAAISLLATLLWLPDFIKKPSSDSTENTQAKRIPLRFWFLGMVVFFGNLSNGLYITAMPLFVTTELFFPETAAGIIMGITAASEIPAMLLAPRLSERFGRMKIFTLAFVIAVVFYASIPFVSTLTTLVLLQLLNGLFFGLFIGLGISIMQDELPNQTGYASAFHTNAMRVGSMAGSSIAGFLAQWVSFQFAISGSAVTSGCALLLLTVIYFFMSNKRSKDKHTQ